jgi:hypothetical protein
LSQHLQPSIVGQIFASGVPQCHIGIPARASYVVRSKVHAAIGRVEDPAETLEYSHDRLQDDLQAVKGGSPT